VLVTPGKPAPDDTEIDARTTSEFASKFNLQLAINASFFYPFREETPWDYYPRRGDRANVLGQAISNRSSYSESHSDFPILCFNSNNQAQIQGSGECSKDTVHAVAGNTLLLERGNPVSLNFNGSDTHRPYPRVAVAIDKKGEKLWLIAIDGKQPLYSEGVTIPELAEIVTKLGAHSALNLDGGGSTTLVAATSKRPTVLNAPIHAKLPMNQRPLANHLGFYALPNITPNTKSKD
jgi:exopolysaccharide biosynthesis protein